MRNSFQWDRSGGRKVLDLYLIDVSFTAVLVRAIALKGPSECSSPYVSRLSQTARSPYKQPKQALQFKNEHDSGCN
eukprot:5318106-Amphidinium_carterae.1